MTGSEAVVRRQIVVNAAITQAFEAFTARFGEFKPPEHNLLQAPIAETVFEPRVGGHIYDRAPRAVRQRAPAVSRSVSNH